MSYICPVCNGLQEMHTECPNCSQPVSDYGRLSDYVGPYSPYLEIDEVSSSVGTRLDQQGACIHLVVCSACTHSYTIQINS
ncbi:hypothetical protein HQN90_23395 [Paenibacillus alba]|uniref:hypothetical protein n=1 Tax=Paenibacillus alba TaxID=1197127 RepID=UPI001563A1A4|nr:hypothetical protein [Paenibacillus alba]NQX69080.1 hypothetical protein [Paenibacillus alba]